VPVEIIKPGTHIDFLGKWRICVALSLALITAGLVAVLAGRGPLWGIDFAGGTEVQIRFLEGDSDEGVIREVVGDLDIDSPSVIRYGGGEGEFLVKFRCERQIAQPGGELPDEVTAETDRIEAIAAALNDRVGPLQVERVEFVGPRVGAELRQAGVSSLSIACLLILIYITFRFSARYAPGAVVALVHDVLITSSLWVLLGLEFDLRVLAALLAIIGYSLNDTIIVYDRIRENAELHTRHAFREVLNRSVNQTLSRTLLTSVTTLLVVLCLLVFGGEVVRPFALAMFFGIMVGTYSSVFVASPTLLWLERRFGDAEEGKPRPRAGKAARA
jgi:preprotein translocase subunit SecF